ncbi:GatB/YqeY domain-containing protein [Roseibaca sp. Y0-43]|uniref:GatB/YqeY domain-containing protein n=1 Tax=Roseibaca sp. Y0-43 TaxID=2816854 RepID=UPI001D0C684F|nr:GatB/YqeY domain-containing protein [Roseibaca sp. Y0-43]MCC1480574.1 GatB/YqeY domain-containing protein [Roseibaca sp. Y0-43]
MSMRETITTALKAAMKERDADRLAALRLINAAIKDRDIAARGEGAPEVSDAEIITVLTRMVKQRRESARAYEEAARLDLAEKELAEIAVIEDFLPRQMDDAEIEKAVASAISETGASSVRDIGRVMGILKTRHAGEMDFAKAGAAVKARLG